MSSLKSGENIQKKEGGPDRSVSDNILAQMYVFLVLFTFLHFFNKKQMLSFFLLETCIFGRKYFHTL